MGYIDQYCERLGPGLFAEPANALTNAAFFIAAWALWRFAGRSNALSGDVVVLIALIVAIGTGSTLFHTFATTWAHWLDIVPILLFQLAFIWVYTRRVIGLRSASTAMIVTGFLGVALYSRQFPYLFNGSLMYAPAFFATFALGFYHWRHQKLRRLTLLAAAGVLLVSIVFRTIDDAVCARVPLGTHFLWHLLNAIVLYLCVLSLLPSGVKRATT